MKAFRGKAQFLSAEQLDTLSLLNELQPLSEYDRMKADDAFACWLRSCQYQGLITADECTKLLSDAKIEMIIWR